MYVLALGYCYNLEVSINHVHLKAYKHQTQNKRQNRAGRGRPMLASYNITELWPTISAIIRHIIKNDVGELSFENCHRYAYIMVIHRGGEQLYNGACQIIRNHLAGLAKQKIIPALPSRACREQTKQPQGEVLLKILAQIWNDHVEGMSRLCNVLKYMVYPAVFFGRYKFDRYFFRIGLMSLGRMCLIFGKPVYESSARKSSSHQERNTFSLRYWTRFKSSVTDVRSMSR
jgi:Cullin family